MERLSGTFSPSITQEAARFWNVGSAGLYAFGVFVAVALLFPIYTNIIYPRFLSPLRSVPGPPHGNPFLGQLQAEFKEPGRVITEWSRQYGPVLRLGPSILERLVFTRPETVQRILVTQSADFPRPDALLSILRMTTGEGILSMTGAMHKQARKEMNQAFSLSALTDQANKYYGPITNLVRSMKAEILERSYTDVKNGNTMPIYDLMSRIALDITSLATFGYKCDSLVDPKNELAIAHDALVGSLDAPSTLALFAVLRVPTFSRFLQSRWLYHHRHWLPGIPLLSNVGVIIDSLGKIRVIAEEILRVRREEELRSGVQERADIASILMKNKRKRVDESMKDDVDEMTEHILTFLAAGRETTAAGMTWALWLLATHPTVQEKLRAEATVALRESPHPDFRTLKDMNYAEAVIMESFRIFPPIPLTFRQAQKDTVIDGVQVPKGQLIHISIRAMCLSKETWGEDAEMFKPERWFNLPPSVNVSTCFQVFLSGPHHCIGKQMAINEMKAILAHLISNFSFEPVYEGQAVHEGFNIALKPTDGMPLRVKLLEEAPKDK